MESFVYREFATAARQRLINAINKANGTAFTGEDILFSPPSWYHDPDKGTNTKITLLGASGSVRGQAEFYYTRHGIMDLFTGTVPEVFVTEDMSTMAHLLEDIAQRYRVRLVPEDIIDEALPDLSSGAVDASLKIHPQSLGWYGHLTIRLTPITTTLDSRITQHVGSIAQYEGTGDRTRAELWFGARRITNQVTVNEWLDNTPMVGDGMTAWMVETIRTYVGLEWSVVPGVVEDNNLYGATIAYIGPNTADIGLPGTRDDIAILIHLAPECQNFGGYLTLVLPEHMVRTYHDAQE